MTSLVLFDMKYSAITLNSFLFLVNILFNPLFRRRNILFISKFFIHSKFLILIFYEQNFYFQFDAISRMCLHWILQVEFAEKKNACARNSFFI